MIQAAHDLGTENLLVVPGAVSIPWRTDYEPVPNDVCDARAKEGVAKLLPLAEKLGVSLNIENIFFNGYLMTPAEMSTPFVDGFQEQARPAFTSIAGILWSTNILNFGFHCWANASRTSHFKEWTKKGTDHSLESFRPLLDGTTNWPAVLEALDKVGYRGYLTFEYFHPYPHYPEAADLPDLRFAGSDARKKRDRLQATAPPDELTGWRGSSADRRPLL